jgi:hypothetical protein
MQAKSRLQPVVTPSDGGFCLECFRIDEISIVTDYNKDTSQLWLTVLAAGVEQ